MEQEFQERVDVETTPEFVKCPGCGSNLEFNPQKQVLSCLHCGTEVDFDKNKEYQEISLIEAFDSANVVDEGSKVYRCENCGAEVVIDATEVATECPFCSTPFVINSQSLKGLKPNAVYPFLVDKSSAKAFIKNKVKKSFFCPKNLKKDTDIKTLHGVYYPCFTFDSQTFSSYEGKVGYRRTRTVRDSRGNTRTETYTEWRYISGTISLNFDDITITATNKITQKTLDKILPYNINDICVYERKFLSGFCASHYDKDIKLCWEEAKGVMDSMIKRAITNKYNCDTVAYINTSTSHNNVTYKYVLMPVYHFDIKYKKKEYSLKMNGTNGKITGKLPVSPLKVFLTSLFSIATVGILGFIIYLFL